MEYQATLKQYNDKMLNGRDSYSNSSDSSQDSPKHRVVPNIDVRGLIKNLLPKGVTPKNDKKNFLLPSFRNPEQFQVENDQYYTPQNAAVQNREQQQQQPQNYLNNYQSQQPYHQSQPNYQSQQQPQYQQQYREPARSPPKLQEERPAQQEFPKQSQIQQQQQAKQPETFQRSPSPQVSKSSHSKPPRSPPPKTKTPQRQQQQQQPSPRKKQNYSPQQQAYTPEANRIDTHEPIPRSPQELPSQMVRDPKLIDTSFNQEKKSSVTPAKKSSKTPTKKSSKSPKIQQQQQPHKQQTESPLISEERRNPTPQSQQKQSSSPQRTSARLAEQILRQSTEKLVKVPERVLESRSQSQSKSGSPRKLDSTTTVSKANSKISSKVSTARPKSNRSDRAAQDKRKGQPIKSQKKESSIKPKPVQVEQEEEEVVSQCQPTDRNETSNDLEDPAEEHNNKIAAKSTLKDRKKANKNDLQREKSPQKVLNKKPIVGKKSEAMTRQAVSPPPAEKAKSMKTTSTNPPTNKALNAADKKKQQSKSEVPPSKGNAKTNKTKQQKQQQEEAQQKEQQQPKPKVTTKRKPQKPQVNQSRIDQLKGGLLKMLSEMSKQEAEQFWGKAKKINQTKKGYRNYEFEDEDEQYVVEENEILGHDEEQYENQNAALIAERFSFNNDYSYTENVPSNPRPTQNQHESQPAQSTSRSRGNFRYQEVDQNYEFQSIQQPETPKQSSIQKNDSARKVGSNTLQEKAKNSSSKKTLKSPSDSKLNTQRTNQSQKKMEVLQNSSKKMLPGQKQQSSEKFLQIHSDHEDDVQPTIQPQKQTTPKNQIKSAAKKQGETKKSEKKLIGTKPATKKSTAKRESSQEKSTAKKELSQQRTSPTPSREQQKLQPKAQVSPFVGNVNKTPSKLSDNQVAYSEQSGSQQDRKLSKQSRDTNTERFTIPGQKPSKINSPKNKQSIEASYAKSILSPLRSQDRSIQSLESSYLSPTTRTSPKGQVGQHHPYQNKNRHEETLRNVAQNQQSDRIAHIESIFSNLDSGKRQQEVTNHAQHQHKAMRDMLAQNQPSSSSRLNYSESTPYSGYGVPIQNVKTPSSQMIQSPYSDSKSGRSNEQSAARKVMINSQPAYHQKSADRIRAQQEGYESVNKPYNLFERPSPQQQVQLQGGVKKSRYDTPSDKLGDQYVQTTSSPEKPAPSKFIVIENQSDSKQQQLHTIDRTETSELNTNSMSDTNLKYMTLEQRIQGKQKGIASILQEDSQHQSNVLNSGKKSESQNQPFFLGTSDETQPYEWNQTANTQASTHKTEVKVWNHKMAPRPGGTSSNTKAYSGPGPQSQDSIFSKLTKDKVAGVGSGIAKNNNILKKLENMKSPYH